MVLVEDRTTEDPRDDLEVAEWGSLVEPLTDLVGLDTAPKEVGSDLERLPMHASGVSLVVADITLSGD